MLGFMAIICDIHPDATVTSVTNVTNAAGELPTNGERSDVAERRGPIYRALEGGEAILSIVGFFHEVVSNLIVALLHFFVALG